MYKSAQPGYHKAWLCFYIPYFEASSNIALNHWVMLVSTELKVRERISDED
jgi:hypothetical protein